MRAGLSPLTTVPWPAENGERDVVAPLPGRDATADGPDTNGVSLDLPCTEHPDLFFAESPQDVEQAKAMCRGCRARLACLDGALERREPWGVWGGELLIAGAIVPRKRPRGRPRKDVAAIGFPAVLRVGPEAAPLVGGAQAGHLRWPLIQLAGRPVARPPGAAASTVSWSPQIAAPMAMTRLSCAAGPSPVQEESRPAGQRAPPMG
jgi:WhiB family transcriptional regulator, redox-sensing transcriptional regulator